MSYRTDPKDEQGQYMVLNVESVIFDMEGIRVTIRHPRCHFLTNAYTYQRRLGDQDCLRDFHQRMSKSLPGVEYVIADGSGQTSHHPSKKLKDIRDSYRR